MIALLSVALAGMRLASVPPTSSEAGPTTAWFVDDRLVLSRDAGTCTLYVNGEAHRVATPPARVQVRDPVDLAEPPLGVVAFENGSMVWSWPSRTPVESAQAWAITSGDACPLRRFDDLLLARALDASTRRQRKALLALRVHEEATSMRQSTNAAWAREARACLRGRGCLDFVVGSYVPRL